MYRALVPAVMGVWAPAVHSNCLHNERAALLHRTLGPTPEDPVDVSGLRQFRMLRKKAQRLGVRRWTREEVVATYSGRMQRRYQQALVDLEDEELGELDARISAFIKGEKFNPLAKMSKPRMIMARTPRFNLELARYLKPLEKALWSRWKVGRGGVKPSRVSGKGLNGPRRAALLARKMEDVGECVVFEVDGKAFEAHVTPQQLAAEHSVYRAAYPRDRYLEWMLSFQKVLSGRTAGGIRFTRPGARASGDYNTGLGNTMLMGAIVDAALDRIETALGRTFRATYLADGDNCLLFVEISVGAAVREMFADATREVSAQELVVESPTTILEEVTFGQSKPCVVPAGLTMVRDPFKTLSGAFAGYRHYGSVKFGLRLMKAIAQCELTLALGVPVLEPYFAAVLAELTKRGVRDLREPESFLEGRLLEVPASARSRALQSVVGVSAESRRSFELAWCRTVEEQRLLEDKLVACVCAYPWDGPVWLDEVLPVGDLSMGDLGDTRDRPELFLGEHW